MNVGLNSALYKSQGIDLKNVENTASKILSSSTKQEAKIEAIDFSKFNRSTLGIDLYSSRTNVDLQRQIATNQTSLYLQSVDVSQLNSKAASSLYFGNITNNTITQANIDTELAAPKALEKAKTIETFSTEDKNSNSSNKFNPFAKTGSEAKEQQERK